MITVTLKIQFSTDWVNEIGDYDVHGRGISSTFRNQEFFGVTILDAAADEFEDILHVIRENQYVRSLDVLETVEEDGRIISTVATECVYPTYTPVQVISLQGFIPIGHSKYKDGYQYIKILGDQVDEVIAVTSDIEYYSVEIINVVPALSVHPSFSYLEWQQLFQRVTPEERALIRGALERGYFDAPRQVSLERLAKEYGVSKTTASKRLRRVEQKIIPLVVKYAYLFYDEVNENHAIPLGRDYDFSETEGL